MLGKTNLTTLKEGAVVTEIMDYKWVKQEIGVSSSLIKVIFKNNYLVGIAADGTIAYTKDGFAWNTTKIKYEKDIMLNDIEWDGKRFLLCGWYVDSGMGSSGGITERGIILETVDFSSFTHVDTALFEEDMIPKNLPANRYAGFRFLSILYVGGVYIVIAYQMQNNDSNRYKYYTISYRTDLKTYVSKKGSYEGIESIYEMNGIQSNFAKNDDSIFFSAVNESSISQWPINLLIAQKDSDIRSYYQICYESGYLISVQEPVPVFTCRDKFYACSQYGGATSEVPKRYNFIFVSCAGNATNLISQDKDFGFISGCYFDGKYIFMNKTSILVVSKESEISDKDVEDMIDIGADSELSLIISAYNQLFIFGKNGLLLKPVDGAVSNTGILVQTLSAKQALSQSKAYTDEQTAALAARVAALEAFH